MTTDPRTVIERWTEIWNTGAVGHVAELVADPCVRHAPGHVVEMRLSDNIERIRTARRDRWPGVRFENELLVADGEYVTSCYTMRWDVSPGADEGGEMAGIEVFRVVDGRIVETWTTSPDRGAWC